MSDRPTIADEFWALLDAACADEITESQWEKLHSYLENDPNARRVFVDHIRLRSSIRLWWKGERSRAAGLDRIETKLPAERIEGDSQNATSCPVFATPPPSGRRFTTTDLFAGEWVLPCVVATVVLCMMLIGAWVYKMPPRQHQPVDVPQQFVADERPGNMLVGRVTGLHECRWADADTETFLGAPVRIDSKYSLDAGLLEITYSTGARVVLEGPCDYVVDSRAGGYLGVGKLIARVEVGGGESGSRKIGDSGIREVGESGIREVGESGDRKVGKSEHRENGLGASSKRLLPTNQTAACGFAHHSNAVASSAPLFAVRTPSAVVTDLGTEFGVIVGEDGDTATHVIEGHVELRVLDDDRPEHQAIRIAAGESIHVERPAKDAEDNLAVVAHARANTHLFPVHPGKLAEYVAEKRLEPFRRWQAFGKELRRRNDLAAYYDFQPDERNRSVLPNLTLFDQPSDGYIEKAVWKSGRFPGKSALAFGWSGGRARIAVCANIDNDIGFKISFRRLTLAAWTRIDAIPRNSAGLVMSDGWQLPGQIHWMIRWDGKMAMVVFVGPRKEIFAVSELPVVDEQHLGQWRLMALVCDLDAKKATFYVDGKSVGQQGIEVGDLPAIKIGCASLGDWYNPGAPFGGADFALDGRMDELMIFNTALSREDILDIYHSVDADSDETTSDNKDGLPASERQAVKAQTTHEQKLPAMEKE